ncbi:MAG: acyltransferase [Paludibacteraceae bacterium]
MKKNIKVLLNKLRGIQSIEKLKKRGLKIGENVTIMGGVIIDPSHCWHIEIGSDVIIAPNVHILAHDASTKIFFGHTRVANVKIGNRVFIGAGTIILPGVTVGDDVVIGAGSVVKKDILPNAVVVGNPAKIICSLDEYIQKQNEKMNDENTFDESFTLRNPNFSEEQRIQMFETCDKQGALFVE